MPTVSARLHPHLADSCLDEGLCFSLLFNCSYNQFFTYALLSANNLNRSFKMSCDLVICVFPSLPLLFECFFCCDLLVLSHFGLLVFLKPVWDFSAYIYLYIYSHTYIYIWLCALDVFVSVFFLCALFLLHPF